MNGTAVDIQHSHIVIKTHFMYQHVFQPFFFA